MASLYFALRSIHNLVGGLTLLAALIAGIVLLVTASTRRNAPLALRAALISASLQGLLGILLIVIALIAFDAGYVATFWPHYLLGLVSVALVSIVSGRARRAPESAARGYGGALVVVAVVIAITYYVGMIQS